MGYIDWKQDGWARWAVDTAEELVVPLVGIAVVVFLIYALSVSVLGIYGGSK